MLGQFFLMAFAAVSVTAIKSNFYLEESCGKVFGSCVLESECPHSLESGDNDRCSGQKQEGAVCCRNFPANQLNCYQLHNICTKECKNNLNIGVHGCTNGTTCCVLV